MLNGSNMVWPHVDHLDCSLPTRTELELRPQVEVLLWLAEDTCMPFSLVRRRKDV